MYLPQVRSFRYGWEQGWPLRFATEYHQREDLYLHLVLAGRRGRYQRYRPTLQIGRHAWTANPSCSDHREGKFWLVVWELIFAFFLLTGQIISTKNSKTYFWWWCRSVRTYKTHRSMSYTFFQASALVGAWAWIIVRLKSCHVYS